MISQDREVVVGGGMMSVAVVEAEPAYDPKNERLQA
jgi:hypothetical protein